MDKLPRVPLSFGSIAELLKTYAQMFPKKEAVLSYDVDSDEVLSIKYKVLSILVYQTADFLLVAGIKKGDKFAILMHNSPEILVLELAGALIGAATVPLDYKRDTLERKIYKLKETAAKALFVKGEKIEEVDPSEMGGVKKELPSLKIFQWDDFAEFEKMTGESKVEDIKRGSLGSCYVILYTSGTTAHPKGALLSQKACFLNAMGIANWQKMSKVDRFGIILPLHHINSTIFSLATLFAGGTVVLVSRYSASKFWEIMAKFKITNTSIVPTILHDQLGKIDEFKQVKQELKLRRICIGSAPVLPEETLKFYKTFAIRVVQGYGQTETALRVAGVPVDLPEKEYIKAVRTNTIGRELANNYMVIMKKIDTRSGEPAYAEASAGEEGEICIKGPVLADGYLDDYEATKRAFIDGWFHSGDLGKYKIKNNEKWYYIVGRIKEIIIKGGVNLSPSAIEDALLKNFPEIEEVAVVGIPDERMGEEVGAAIRIKNYELRIMNKIIERIKNKKIQGLSEYEMPKKVFFVDSLPKTSTGKIQRVVVKKMILSRLPQENSLYLIRQIKPEEVEILTKAAKIETERFGLTATKEQFIQRAKNGIVWGAFFDGELAGSLSCVRMDLADLKKVKSWGEVTSKGTLANNNPKGDTIVCIAISVASRNNQNYRGVERSSHRMWAIKKLIAQEHIKKYVDSGRDHVLAFHMKPKGGLSGAKAWKILEDGRPEDEDASGYNVLMKYPDLRGVKRITFTHGGRPAILLIETSLDYVLKNGLKHVVAFSRPAGFGEYLLGRKR